MTETIDHASRDHAVISPSSVYRTMKCFGWIEYCKDIVTTTSEFAEEGTLAHEIAEYYGRYGTSHTVPEEVLLKGDEDMHFYGKNYARFLDTIEQKFAEKATGSLTIKFEARVRFSENIWGTLDYEMHGLCGDRYKAVLTDYKYGKGVEVEAEDNSQLKTYAAALQRELGGVIDDFYFFIYQPRTPGNEYSSWKCDRDEIESWSVMLEELERNVLSIQYGDGLNAQGLDHCRFCPGKFKCPAFLEEVEENALAVLDDAPDFEPPRVTDLSTEQLVKILERKKAIEHFLKDVEAHLMRELEAGKEVPGYKLVNGRSVRKWGDDEEMVARSLRELGVEVPYRKSLITIAEAEKQIGGGKKAKEALEPLTQKTTPRRQIAPESDKRKAVDVAEQLASALTVIE